MPVLLADRYTFPPGIIALPLEKAYASYGSFLKSMAVTSASGLFLYIPPKKILSEPLYLPPDAPQVVIACGKEASLQLVVNRSGSKRFDLSLDEGARMSLTLLSPDFQSLRAQLKRGSNLSSISVNQGSSQDYQVTLLGEGASVKLQGAILLKERAKAATQVLITHDAPRTTSHQHFKSIVSDGCLSSFQGKIYVSSWAEKTEAYQKNNSLLLGEHAIAHSRPQLEIFASDVKASHGATIAHLAKEQLFYLQSRGLCLARAKELLIQGFYREITDPIPLFSWSP